MRPTDDEEELRPLTAPASTSGDWWRRARSDLRGALGLDPNSDGAAPRAEANTGDFLRSFRDAMSERQIGTLLAASGPNQAADDGENAGGEADAPPAPPVPVPPDMPRGDIQAAAHWMEDSMPFMMLLLVVFLYRHLLSIIIFFWLTSLLHNANERSTCMRRLPAGEAAPPAGLHEARARVRSACALRERAQCASTRRVCA